MIGEKMSIEKAIAEYGFVVHTFRGTSMLPMLRQGIDAVRLIAVREKLKKYDIPLYVRNDGALVLHRIIRVKRDGYIIRGDNCLWNEEVKHEQIIAVAEGIYQNGKYKSGTCVRVKWYAIRQWLTLPWRRLRWYMNREKSY